MKMNKRQLKKAKKWWETLELHQIEKVILHINVTEEAWKFKPTDEQLHKMYQYTHNNIR